MTEAPHRPNHAQDGPTKLPVGENSSEVRYRPETGCAASAVRRGDLLAASAPPAARWLLIECRTSWPRDALTAIRRGEPPSAKGDSATAGVNGLAAEVARLCAGLRCRPVLIRRYGRQDQTAPRRWAMVDSRPGQESIRWGELPSNEHLLNVLTGKDQGTPSAEAVYLVCTHGRHDACCAVWGRPAAATLSAAHPDRTWECSHVGGDRFAPNIVLLPHSLFYGHVPPSRVVELATSYDEGVIVPEFFRGSGAFPPPVQAAQHFARAAGHSLGINALRPTEVHQLAPDHWQIRLTNTHPPNQASADVITVEVAAHMVTIDGAMTCASKPPGRVRQFTLVSGIETR